MNAKVDQPYPPRHYKSPPSDPLQGLSSLLSKTENFALFGSEIETVPKEIPITRELLMNCQTSHFLQVPLKPELLHLLDKATTTLAELFALKGERGEEVKPVLNRLYEIFLHVFYVLKVARNTVQAPLQLAKAMKTEAIKLENVIADLKKLIEEVRTDLEQII